MTYPGEPAAFVNRAAELASLSRWWDSPRNRAALRWGRRRVGKTALLQRFCQERRTVFHTGAGRPLQGELAQLSRQVDALEAHGIRDLAGRPYRDWDDALEGMAALAGREPLLLVLDEFPELVRTSPELPGVIRAFLDRLPPETRLRVLICGSAVRTMRAIQEERAPLYGRFDLALQLSPFRPSEAALMLPGLKPADRALVHGIVGGTPLYLSWWDQDADLATNLLQLACRPGAPLLTEGQLILATEVEAGEHPAAVLYAIASGKTHYQEIKDQLRSEPARSIDRLIELGLVERQIPVTESPRTRRRIYRIADNFLTFYLGLLSRYRAEIDRGLGRSILPVLIDSLDDHIGATYEEAFRDHLRAEAAQGRLGPRVVAVGRWWKDTPAVEIDAVALEGRGRRPMLAGEAKWSRHVNARAELRLLRQKAASLVDNPDDLKYAICARERVLDAPVDVLTVTAGDIFAPPTA